MIAYCPVCEQELQDEGDQFFCLRCQAAVSYAAVAAEGV